MRATPYISRPSIIGTPLTVVISAKVTDQTGILMSGERVARSADDGNDDQLPSCK